MDPTLLLVRSPFAPERLPTGFSHNYKGERMRKLMRAGIVPAVAVALFASACSSNSSSGTSGSGGKSSGGSGSSPSITAADSPLVVKAGALNFDFTKYCPTKSTTVAILDGYGGNAWAVGKRAMLTKLAKSCPKVTKVLYADANGDVQKYISAVNSLVAQGANVLETFDLFGQPPVSAFSRAQRQGVLVGEANAVPGTGRVPKDLTSVVVPDFDSGAALWVKFLTKATNNAGKIAYIGGPAGNLFDGPALAAVQKAIKDQGSGIQVVTSEPQVGNWDPATTQQVMTGLLQKNPAINGVILSYTATGPAVIRAYQAAKLPLPAISGQSSSMELICQTHKLQPTNKTLQVQSLDGSANLDAIALAKILSVYSGKSAPELGPDNDYTRVTYAAYVDTVSGVLPACDSSLPPGADLSMALDKADMAAAFRK